MSSVTKPHTNKALNLVHALQGPCARGAYQAFNTIKYSGTHALAGLITGISPIAGAIIGGTSCEL